MCKFINLPLDSPNDVEFVNIDCIASFGKGANGHAKLYVTGVGICETKCSYTEFLEILETTKSEVFKVS